MTQYDLLKTAESVLKMMDANKVDVKDVRHLRMYSDYLRLKREGHKICYVAYYLSQQYECGVATVYRVVKRMEQDII